MKTGRNQPCPCGSGRKYKKCCGNAINVRPSHLPGAVDEVLRRQEGRERIRIEQQGRGKPIIAAQWQGYQLVAAGGTLYYSKKWRVFPDFLSDYIKSTLGSDWGNEELRRPLQQRHPILQWYDVCCRLLAKTKKIPGEIRTVTATGGVYCYLGLAYSLYLLKHNVALQERLVKRLKDPGNFQGAYYEIIVANCLIRAGFDLTLENETDDSTKHCEFAAVSKRTRKKYWVEAKMRSVSGLFGRGDCDGSKQSDPASAVTTHLRKALKKPAADERLVFIDVNAPTTESDHLPKWADSAFKRLERSERDSKPSERAYVFCTNLPYHRSLEEVACAGGILGYGFGIPDFGKRDRIGLAEAFRRKQKHIDAYYIGESFRTYPQIPTTFDGSFPSEASGKPSRCVEIGQTYFFEDAGPNGMIGKVTAATVSESEKRVYYGVTAEDGKSYILKGDMTDADLDNYRAHKDAYFGVIQRVPREMKTPFELFEWMVDCYQKTTKEKLIELAKGAPDMDVLSTLPRDELVLELCERWVSGIVSQNEMKQRTSSSDA